MDLLFGRWMLKTTNKGEIRRYYEIVIQNFLLEDDENMRQASSNFKLRNLSNDPGTQMKKVSPYSLAFTSYTPI